MLSITYQLKYCERCGSLRSLRLCVSVVEKSKPFTTENTALAKDLVGRPQ